MDTIISIFFMRPYSIVIYRYLFPSKSDLSKCLYWVQHPEAEPCVQRCVEVIVVRVSFLQAEPLKQRFLSVYCIKLITSFTTFVWQYVHIQNIAEEHQGQALEASHNNEWEIGHHSCQDAESGTCGHLILMTDNILKSA